MRSVHSCTSDKDDKDSKKKILAQLDERVNTNEKNKNQQKQAYKIHIKIIRKTHNYLRR